MKQIKPLNIKEEDLGQKHVRLYIDSEEPLPLVINVSFFDQTEMVIDAANKEKCPPFNLLSISNLRWDEELSPWQSEPIVEPNDHFTGEAPDFLAELLSIILPWGLENLPAKPTDLIIAGYSMGGLFAVWSLYQTDRFNKAVSASGSLWFPNFLDYALAHKLKGKPEAVYFSLGRKEVKMRNPYLKMTGDIMETLCLHYQKEGIKSVFEWNPGNHYTDPMLRLAKGIRWAIEN